MRFDVEPTGVAVLTLDRPGSLNAWTGRMHTELRWVMDRAEEHLGEERAGRYLRKFYPWYLDQLDVSKVVRNELCQTAGLERAREIVSEIRNGEPVIA